jgi:hypothetical protein
MLLQAEILEIKRAVSKFCPIFMLYNLLSSSHRGVLTILHSGGGSYPLPLAMFQRRVRATPCEDGTCIQPGHEACFDISGVPARQLPVAPTYKGAKILLV